MASLIRRVGVLVLVVLGVLPGARADVFVVTSTDDSGAGTLSAAVSSANLHPGADEIHFNLSGPAPYLIELSGDLNLSEQLLLDGTSQPGYTDHPLIEVRFPGRMCSRRWRSRRTGRSTVRCGPSRCGSVGPRPGRWVT